MGVTNGSTVPSSSPGQALLSCSSTATVYTSAEHAGYPALYNARLPRSDSPDSTTAFTEALSSHLPMPQYSHGTTAWAPHTFAPYTAGMTGGLVGVCGRDCSLLGCVVGVVRVVRCVVNNNKYYTCMNTTLMLFLFQFQL